MTPTQTTPFEVPANGSTSAPNQAQERFVDYERVAAGTAQFCSSCGSPRRPGAKFCSTCGTSMARPSVAPPAEPQVAFDGGVESATRVMPQPEPLLPPDMKVYKTRSRRGRVFGGRRARIAAAVVVLVGAAGTAFVIVNPFDHSRDEARSELAARAADLTGVLRGAQRASSLEAVRSVGSSAESRLAAFTGSVRALDGIGDDRIRAESLAALRAEREVMASFAGLADLRPENLDAWGDTELNVSHARIRLEREAQRLSSLGLGTDLLPRGGQVERATRALDREITTADRKLTEWRRHYRQALRRRNSDLQALEGYAEAVQGQMAHYASLRTDLDQWIASYGADQLPFGQADTFLSQAISDRQAVRNSLAALRPPVALQADHAQLETVLDQSLRAMENAVDGARECTEDMFCLGEDFRETVDWREFMRASDEISGRFPAARSSFETTVRRLSDEIKARRLPSPPRV